MIDWLTLQIDSDRLSDETLNALRVKHSLIMCLNPDGSVEWQRPARREVRSDSHQITVELCGSLRIYGSPARVGLKTVDNVFGSGDPLECADRMLRFVESVEGVQLPEAQEFSCTRMDVTHNYDMGCLVNVKSALEILRHAEGGRYQVRTAAETVYWSTKSTVRSGKAYSKGEHMRYLDRRGRAHLDQEKMQLCDGLLRMELSLRRHYFARQCPTPWHQLEESQLDQIHGAYFGQLIGSVEISERTDMRRACIDAALRLGLSEGQGKAAFLSWTVIQSQGYQAWREYSPRSTFYRHKKILREAGLSYADFAARNVVPLRVRRLELARPVRSWHEIKRAA